MKFTTVQKAFLALIVANTIWGAASPIFKLSLQNIPPFTLAFLRFFIAAVILLPILRGAIRLKLTSRRDFLLLLTNALLGITVNIIFFFLGLRLTLALNAPVIASAAPIITLFVAILFLREPFRWKRFLGMLLGTIGILVIIFEPLLAQGFDGSVVGNLFLLLATFGAVGGTVTGRELLKKYPPLTHTFWTFAIGTASFLPLAVYEYVQNPLLYAALDWRGYLGIIFGGFLSSAAAYSLFNWGLSKISATDTAMFTYIDPVAGGVLSVLILKEPITGLFLLGAALIFVGIGIAEGRLHYHPFHKLQTSWRKTSDIEPPSYKPTSRTSVIKHIFKNN